ncbi:MAG: hypothetical protein CMI56_00845 [Parcubacteria group bacterium]|nr:hypothetical protein [Parcubacteria group bacterium]
MFCLSLRSHSTEMVSQIQALLPDQVYRVDDPELRIDLFPSQWIESKVRQIEKSIHDGTFPNPPVVMLSPDIKTAKYRNEPSQSNTFVWYLQVVPSSVQHLRQYVFNVLSFLNLEHMISEIQNGNNYAMVIGSAQE